MRRVRITSTDGIHAQIVDVETGANIAHSVTHVAIEMDPREVVKATLQLCLLDVSTDAEARFTMRHPTTGEWTEVSGITFADGSGVEL